MVAFGTLGLIWLLARPLAIFVLAFTIAQALSPLVDWLAVRIPRLSRTGAVVLVYLTILGVLALLVSLLLPTIATEGRQLTDRAPELIDRALRWASGWTGLSTDQLQQSSVDWLTRARSTLVQIPAVTISALFEMVVIFFLSLYLLMAGPDLRRFVLSLLPRRHCARAKRLMTRMGRAMGGYVRGAAMDGAVMAVLTWIALAVIGVPFAPVFALFAGFAEFVPYVGPILAALPAIGVAAVESPTRALVVAATYLTLQQIDSHLIVPNIMRSQTKVHPALVILALASGFAVGGVLGAIVSIPLFAAARVLLVYAIAPALRRRARRTHLATETV
jgi:predicted PurR-regulated permease PerM